MSDHNNNFNIQEITRQWEGGEIPFPCQSTANNLAEQDLRLESYTASLTETDCARTFNLQITCVQTLHQDAAPDNPSHSGSWPAGGEESSQMESARPMASLEANCEQTFNLEITCVETLHQQPSGELQNGDVQSFQSPLESMDAHEAMEEVEESESEYESEQELIFESDLPIYYEPSTASNVVSGSGLTASTETPLNAQVNHSRLDLRPVPGSLDLTRNRPVTWHDSHPFCIRAGALGRRATADSMHRLNAEEPLNQQPVPEDDGISTIVLFQNESDSEDDPSLPPLAMVARRGNSVSDVSQCSSDDCL